VKKNNKDIAGGIARAAEINLEINHLYLLRRLRLTEYYFKRGMLWVI